MILFSCQTAACGTHPSHPRMFLSFNRFPSKARVLVQLAESCLDVWDFALVVTRRETGGIKRKTELLSGLQPVVMTT